MTIFGRHRGFFLLSVTFLLVHLIPATANATVSPPYLVGNFNDRSIGPGLQPLDVVPLGDGRLAVLVARRLWLTDGTAAGTEPLCGAVPDGTTECPPVSRILAGGATGVFFQSGERPWFTDGTIEGTFPLTDPLWRLAPRFEFGGFLFHPGRGLLFFAAGHPLHGSELWVSDGTRAGTRMLGDLVPGPRSSSPEFGAVAGDRVVFSADGDGGREVWVTDGTPEGTRLLREIRPGPGSSVPALFRSLGDLAVFGAEDDLRGRELWVTDGTPEGTEPLPEIVPGPGDLVLDFPSEVSVSRLFFFAHVGLEVSLWITDGTPEGTRELQQLGEQTVGILSVVGHLAFFVAAAPASGREPWISDGTPEGTRILRDVCPGICSSNPGFFSPLGTHAFFSAEDEEAGREPWISDGTLGGTRRLGDLAPGPMGSQPFLSAGNHRRLFFSARTPSLGGGLWVSEAPFTTARPLIDPETGLVSSIQSSVLLGDDLLGVKSDAEHGAALWRSDGTGEGTRPVRTLIEPIELGSHPSRLSRVGDRVFFTTDRFGPEIPATLWRTGGTPDTTVPILEIDSAPEDSERDFQSLTPLEDRLVFLLRNEEGHLDLWSTDGTPETTRPLVRDVDDVRSDAPLPVTGGMAFLLEAAVEPEPVLGAPSALKSLWVTDGTADGTRGLRKMLFGGPNDTGVFQGRLFFSGAQPPGADFELWVSDGTSEGTVPFAALNSEGPSHPRNLTVADDLLLFVADSTDGPRLWRTDGTPESTRVVDLPPEAAEGFEPLAALGDRLIFTSYLREIFDLEEPTQFSLHALWSTDGTREGTTRLAEVRSRKGQLGFQRFVVGDQLFLYDFYFSFDFDPSLIWRTDGTPEGTLPWRYLPRDRQPVAHHAVDGGLAIEATGPAGRELWWSGDLASAELVGAFANVGEPTRLGDLVLFRGASRGLGTELWAFEAEDVEVQPPVRPLGVPEAPDRLEVFATDFGNLTAVWRDRSSNETSFVLEARSPLSAEFETVAVLPADLTRVRLGIAPLPYTFRVRAENANGVSAWSDEASAQSRFDLDACIPSDEHLCLLGGRFEVLVGWRDPFNGGFGFGHAVPFDFSDDSGTFWFFDPANVELVVKVLDARTVNGFHWAFYGALTNVEYWVTVRDLLEDTSRTYHNPAASLCGFGDTRAFPRPGPLAVGSSEVPFVEVEAPRPLASAKSSSTLESPDPGGPPAPGPPGPGGGPRACTESETTLCLTGDRFRAQVSWRDPRSGDTGVGFTISGTDDSGFFWFFDPENVELVVKVLDARTVNGHFWVFSGGLSDVEYTITVTDTVDNVARSYRNEPFDICGQADTAAF